MTVKELKDVSMNPVEQYQQTMTGMSILSEHTKLTNMSTIMLMN